MRLDHLLSRERETSNEMVDRLLEHCLVLGERGAHPENYTEARKQNEIANLQFSSKQRAEKSALKV